MFSLLAAQSHEIGHAYSIGDQCDQYVSNSLGSDTGDCSSSQSFLNPSLIHLGHSEKNAEGPFKQEMCCYDIYLILFTFSGKYWKTHLPYEDDVILLAKVYTFFLSSVD